MPIARASRGDAACRGRPAERPEGEADVLAQVGGGHHQRAPGHGEAARTAPTLWVELSVTGTGEDAVTPTHSERAHDEVSNDIPGETHWPQNPGPVPLLAALLPNELHPVVPAIAAEVARVGA